MRAFISVRNKTGIDWFARELVKLDVEIVSAGGTAKFLRAGGIPVKDIADISGLEPILDHRVATLVPHLHGGLLAESRHVTELAHLATRKTNPIVIPWFDLVCNDPYPLKEAIGKAGATRESVIEETDIGGPTMLMSAAKGRRIVIVDFDDRKRVIDWLKAGRPDEEKFITYLVAKAYGFVADYYLTAARYHSAGKIDGVVGAEVYHCKYGENAHQKDAGLYASPFGAPHPLTISQFKLIEGNPMSLTNMTDVYRLRETMVRIAAAFDLNYGFVPDIAIGVKHGNACGAAMTRENPTAALELMVKGSPLSLFGGFVMANFPIDGILASILRNYLVPKDAGKRVLDGVVAPSFTEEAQQELGRKNGQCRMIVNPALATLGKDNIDSGSRFRDVGYGEFLKQQNSTFILDFKDPRLERLGKKNSEPQQEHMEQNLLFAWAIGSTSNSNTVVLVKNNRLIGMGVSQPDRVGAAELAIHRARRNGHDTKGSFAYSDSFFPFTDGPALLADAGVEAIFTSSGSRNDGKVKELCRERGVILYMMPDELCRGFYGHG